MNEFTIGQCPQCGKHKALCNGVCAECKDKVDIPDFIEDLFGGFKDNDKKS